MKDEELFKAWKSEQYKDQSDEERFEFVEHLHNFPKHFETTFLAGLNTGRPQWHDLRKDPNDLPKDDMSEVAIITPSGEWEKGIFRRIDDECYWRIIGFKENVKVIAWCEIPTFDKE